MVLGLDRGSPPWLPGLCYSFHPEEEVQPGSVGSTVLAYGLASGSKACMLRHGPGCLQSPLGQFPWVGPRVPFPLPRPHQQKQSHGHQDGTATHACQAQELEGPAPSPFHQEHLRGESGLARGL